MLLPSRHKHKNNQLKQSDFLVDKCTLWDNKVHIIFMTNTFWAYNSHL